MKTFIMMDQMHKKENTSGFTLIELLVVIAIIGMLSSVVLASLNSARGKARDSRRKADLKQLMIAIEMFYDTTGSYPQDGCPDDTSTGCTIGDDSTWDGSSGGLARTKLNHNITEFMSTLPVDPINDSTYHYRYEPHCHVAGNAQGFWVRARMESDGAWYYVRSGPQGSSPCPGCNSCW